MVDIASILRGRSSGIGGIQGINGPMAGGGMPTNILQQISDDRLNAPMPAPVAQAPEPAAEAPRQRRSALDVIGRLADVFATVGGSEALYQPTLDAREDRGRAQQLEEMRKQQMQQQLSMGSEELANLQRAKVGMAIKGLQAVQRSGGDINAAWPILAERAGISPEEAAQFGSVLQRDPNAISGLSAMFGADREFGLQPFYAQDAEGNLVAYQIGKDGSLQQVNLPEGQSPIDPLKFVDTGNQQVGVGTRSGRPVRILPKGQSPDAAARNRTTITVAGMRGAGRTGGAKEGPDPAAIARGAQPVVSALKDSIERLYKSGGMTSEKSGAVGTAAAIARENIPGVERFVSPEGFSAREDFTRLTTVGIPALLPLLGGLTIGGKNIDAAKELDTWRNAIASAKDYPSAMRAVKGFEDRINELVQKADQAPAAAPAARTAPNRPAPRRNVQPRGSNKPSVSNW